MRKPLLIATTALLLATVGATLAQGIGPSVSGPGVAGSGASNTDVTASHQVSVHIPTIVLLQIKGTSSSTTADVQFSPTANDIYAASSTPIAANPATATSNPSTFTKVRGFTNGSNSVTVTANVATNATGSSIPTTDGTILDNLELRGAKLHNGVTTNITAGAGWTDLWTLSDFGLLLSGTEAPGTYSYTVTYTATVP